MTYVLSYDFGTGGIKASLFDVNAVSHGFVFREYPTYYPAEDYREQKPTDWWEAFVTSTKELLANTDIDSHAIAAIAISGHSLGVVAIDHDGALLSDYTPIWSDKRATAEATRFFESIDEREWYEKTGNGFPVATYSLFKIMWYRDHMPSLYENAICFLGTKDYINFKLTGRLCTDHSYASGSGAYDLRRHAYEPRYLEAAGVALDKLPAIMDSTERIGHLTEEAASLLGLSVNTAVFCGGVDNMCMALGANCCQNGDSYLSLGTSSWIAVSGETPVLNFDKKPYVFVHYRRGLYVSSTCIFAAGSALHWAKTTLGKNIPGYRELDELADSSPVGANGLLFNPSLAGGSSLYASSDVRGGFCGLDLKHTQADVLRSCLEGIAFDLRASLEVLREHAALRPDMLMVGGGANSTVWRQIFADIFNMAITRTTVGQDAAALGAAALAFLGLGLWQDLTHLKQAHRHLDRSLPRQDNTIIYDRIFHRFQRYAQLLSNISTVLHE